MKLDIFVIYDEISDGTVILGTGNNEKSFIRQNLPYLAKLNPSFKNEFKIYKVGFYSEGSKSLESCEPVEIDWDSYSPSESPTNI